MRIKATKRDVSASISDTALWDCVSLFAIDDEHREYVLTVKGRDAFFKPREITRFLRKALAMVEAAEHENEGKRGVK